MATIKLQGSSGGGSVTLTAPVTAANRTITLPDQDIDLGNLGGVGAIDAWCNWTGDPSVSIRGSGNVSTVTDQGVGRYRVNYSTSFSSASGYTAVSSAGGNLVDYAAQDNAQDHNSFQGNKATSSVPVFSVDHDGGEQDDAYNMDVVCVGA